MLRHSLLASQPLNGAPPYRFHSEELIRSISGPLGERPDAHLREVIEQEAQLTESLTRQNSHADLERVKADERAATAGLEQNTRLLAQAESEQKGLPPGSWVKAFLYSMCGLACFSSEFTLTWVTLPFLLNTPKRSVLGVMLALAPASALVILDLVFGGLHLIQDPRDLLQSKVFGPVKRVLAASLLTVFLVVLAWINLQTVLLLAGFRGEATKIRQSLAELYNDNPIPVDVPKINRTILWVSLMVTLDGAVCLLVGMSHARKAWKEARLRSRLSRLHKQCLGLKKEHMAAAGRLEVEQKAYEETKERAQLAAARFRAQRLFELERAVSQRPPTMSSLEVIQKRLAFGLAR